VKSSFVPSHARFVPSFTLRALALTGANGSAGIFGISIFGIVIFGILIQLHGEAGAVVVSVGLTGMVREATGAV
jgi:hypothetical protein